MIAPDKLVGFHTARDRDPRVHVVRLRRAETDFLVFFFIAQFHFHLLHFLRPPVRKKPGETVLNRIER